MSAYVIEATKAILLLGGRYVLQLRDDKPGIANPNCWGLFGGLREPGESNEQAIRRELKEELEITPALRFLWPVDFFSSYENGLARCWVFVASIDHMWQLHRLHEGQAAQAFAYSELTSLPLAEEVAIILDRFVRDGIA